MNLQAQALMEALKAEGHTINRAHLSSTGHAYTLDLAGGLSDELNSELLNAFTAGNLLRMELDMNPPSLFLHWRPAPAQDDEPRPATWWERLWLRLVT